MNLPKSWDEITIGQFLDIRGVLNMRDIDNIDRNVQLLSVLAGQSVEELEELSIQQISEAVASIDFMDKLPKAKAATWFTLRGRVFKVATNPRNLTYGQFIDLTSFIKDKDSIVENMHKILAVISVPLLSSYNGEKHEKHATFFHDHMPVSFAYALALFFCQLLNASARATEDYLQDQANLRTGEAIRLLTSMPSIGAGT